MAPKRKEAPEVVDADALADAVEAAKRKAQARTRTLWQENPQARCSARYALRPRATLMRTWPAPRAPRLCRARKVCLS